MSSKRAKIKGKVIGRKANPTLLLFPQHTNRIHVYLFYFSPASCIKYILIRMTAQEETLINKDPRLRS